MTLQWRGVSRVANEIGLGRLEFFKLVLRGDAGNPEIFEACSIWNRIYEAASTAVYDSIPVKLGLN